jgi:hypothetical protein
VSLGYELSCGLSNPLNCSNFKEKPGPKDSKEFPAYGRVVIIEVTF